MPPSGLPGGGIAFTGRSATLLPSAEADVHRGDDQEEEALRPVTDSKILKVIIKQQALVDTFGTSPVFVEILPLF